MKNAHFPFDRHVDHERGRVAAQAARLQGKSALECALAQIEASFSVATRHDLRKHRIRVTMNRCLGDPELLRYRQIAEQMPSDMPLDAATIIAERFYQMEVRRREHIEHTWGFCHEPRIRLMVLDELRLMLRWCRRYAPQQFEMWRDCLNGG